MKKTFLSLIIFNTFADRYKWSEIWEKFWIILRKKHKANALRPSNIAMIIPINPISNMTAI